MWLTFWLGSAFGAEAGFLAALLLGFTVLLTAEATIATTDAVLLAATLGAMGVLMRLYRAAREGGVRLHRSGPVGLGGFAIAHSGEGPGGGRRRGATILALLIWDGGTSGPRKRANAERRRRRGRGRASRPASAPPLKVFAG